MLNTPILRRNKRNLITKIRISNSIGTMKPKDSISSLVPRAQPSKSIGNKTSSIKESLSTLKLTPCTDLIDNPEKNDEKIIPYTIEASSNWGNSKVLKISSIWFLDKERSYLKPIAINSFPKINKSDLNKLICHRLPDLVSNDMFTHKWPPEDDKKLSMVFFFNSDKLPSYVRIWNPQKSEDSSVKDVTIKQGQNSIWNGEIPMGFVKDIPLLSAKHIIQPVKSEQIMLQLFPELGKPPEISNDKFGLYPIIKTQRIRLEIFSNWNQSNGRVGLNAIQFFDITFSLITQEAIEDYFVENCTMFSNPGVLIKRDPLTSKEKEMFWADSDFKMPPTIVITFKQPVFLSQVVVWNYNAEGSDGEIGVKDAKLRARKKLLWGGRVRKATGSVRGAPSFATPIWLTDNPEIRRREFLC